MPSGRVHRRLWITNAPNALFLAAGVFAISPLISAGVLAGYAIGDVVEPDLDMIQKTRSENVVLEKLGALGCVWFGYWAVYGCLLRRSHRDAISHAPIASTAIRFIYTFWWWWFLIPPQRWLDTLMIGVFLGLVISDSVHIIADALLSQSGGLAFMTKYTRRL